MLQRAQALSPEMIRTARRAVGLSQGELASRLGYTASWLSNIERGTRGLPWREAPRLVEVLTTAYAAHQEWDARIEELGLSHLPVASVAHTAGGTRV